MPKLKLPLTQQDTYALVHALAEKHGFVLSKPAGAMDWRDFADFTVLVLAALAARVTQLEKKDD